MYTMYDESEGDVCSLVYISSSNLMRLLPSFRTFAELPRSLRDDCTYGSTHI